MHMLASITANWREGGRRRSLPAPRSQLTDRRVGDRQPDRGEWMDGRLALQRERIKLYYLDWKS